MLHVCLSAWIYACGPFRLVPNDGGQRNIWVRETDRLCSDVVDPPAAIAAFILRLHRLFKSHYITRTADERTFFTDLQCTIEMVIISAAGHDWTFDWLRQGAELVPDTSPDHYSHAYALFRARPPQHDSITEHLQCTYNASLVHGNHRVYVFKDVITLPDQ